MNERVDITLPPLAPRMSEGELRMFEGRLRSARHYLEFGSGGSTALATQCNNLLSINSVESSASWIGTLRSRLDIQMAEFSGRLTLHHVDIGPTKELGYPADDSDPALWPNYFNSVWDTLPDAPDLVLVDGRFRVACTLAAIQHCPPSTTIVIHDFWNRTVYHPVLNFLDYVESSSTLGVMRPRAAFHQDDLLSLMEQHSKIPH